MSIPTRRRGFSIIELVVVMAILGILLTLAAAAASSARAAARNTSCSNNLHQLSLGLHNWAESSGGRLPNQNFPLDFAWTVKLLPMIECGDRYEAFNIRLDVRSTANHTAASRMPTLFQCPNAPEAKSVIEGVPAGDFGFNGILSGRRVQAARGTSHVVLLAEAATAQVPWPLGPEAEDNEYSIGRGHESGRNVAYLDGSIRFLGWTERLHLNPDIEQ